MSSVAAEALTEPSQVADRDNCAEIGLSDLRSPPEGLWFQSNCVAPPAAQMIASLTKCNRTILDPADFTLLAPGLYVSRLTPASQGFLWYASSEACFDLVSSRVVGAVCADQTVTFNRSTSACTAHGGVLGWVNGR